MTRRLFALERYDRSGGQFPPDPGADLTVEGTRLVAAIHLPADDVVLVLVEGPDAATVTAAATAAGWRVDRLNPAAWIHPITPAGRGDLIDPPAGVPGSDTNQGEQPCGA